MLNSNLFDSHVEHMKWEKQKNTLRTFFPKKLKFDVSANGVTLETVVIGHTIINELMRFQKKTIFQILLDFKILNELKHLPATKNLFILLELMRFI